MHVYEWLTNMAFLDPLLMSSATPTQRGVYILNGIKSHPLVSSCSMSRWFLFNRTTVSLTRLHTFTILYNSRDCFQVASTAYTLYPSTSPLGPST
jgi:hypothetical protein